MNTEKNLILFDDITWENLLPLTYTRPVSEIRTGILTIKEKWEKNTSLTCSYLTREYLQKKYPIKTGNQNIYINSCIIPDAKLIESIDSLETNECLVTENCFLAVNAGNKVLKTEDIRQENFKTSFYKEAFIHVQNTWDIFMLNGQEINTDFELITKGRTSQQLDKSNRCLNPENIFIEEGAHISFATINASEGKVYIGKDSEVMEGAVIRGPFAMGNHSAIKMGAKIYGGTTLGPHCKVGGEVHSSVFFGYSNKAHDGFLGNSVLGEWCNLGADTNNSNLKNNYALVKLWNYQQKKFVNTGLQFCGLIMGDHSKCGINTMFNTGTVVGVSANLFGAGFPRNFIPSFSWGGAAGYSVYTYNKAIETAEIVYKRRNIELAETDKDILSFVFNMTEQYRKF